ncbi:MAG: hypothetical protein KKG00_11880 [Bacteroidetes bacterium]|nr:hypothetical protein [Bacteroidota bacterium]
MPTDYEVRNFIIKTFDRIESATTIEELTSIENSNLLQPNTINTAQYPKINFKITPSEINELRKKGILDDKYDIVEGAIDKVQDPLARIFYSILWKNGDLTKMKHIIQGVADTRSSNNGQLPDSAIVFYQFGKYLSGNHGEPIIDQHILRAFGIYKTANVLEVTSWRQLKLIKREHHSLINDYKKWLHSDVISHELKACKDYTYYIDRVLFALGKWAKQR